MTDPMLPLPGLSPVSGKSVIARFDGGLLSSDAGVLALREVEPGRMAAIGYGEGYPVADNSTPQGRELNRRVSILVKGKA